MLYYSVYSLGQGISTGDEVDGSRRIDDPDDGGLVALVKGVRCAVGRYCD